MGWPVQAYLHGNVHHHSAEHEGRVRGRGLDRQGPGTEYTERLNDMAALRIVRQSRPD